MAKKDSSTESEGSQRSTRRPGLGRGLGALIPDTTSSESVAGSSRPLDVLFPDGEPARAQQPRGGSARDLLNPRQKRPTTAPRSSRADGEQANKESKKKRPAKKTSRSKKASVADKVATPVDSQETKQAKGSSNVSRETSSSTPIAEERQPERKATIEEVVSEPVVSEAPQASTSENVSRETKENTGSDIVEAEAVGDSLQEVPGASFAELRLEWIIPNSRQPREVFDEDELNELASSIREVGVLQPIVVRVIDTSVEPTERLRELLEDKPEARFELIMGERRLRASEIAGQETIPAIIRQTEDADLLRDALLENLHRAQLNPLEEASAYQQLMADFGATQEELSQKIARSRPQIANTLRLLKLPPGVQVKVAAGTLSSGHARALLGLTAPEEMERLADRIIAEGLSVRTTEELVRLGQLNRPSHRPVKRVASTSALGESIATRLSDAYDTRVVITEGARKGKIVIEFAGPEDLQRLADLILSK
ncbi:MAG: chromosome partitioning protein ParB [Actinobacteria bacterium]|nr:MAG: chromosome partitioning protein ParB [Actinomycetota bacterium]